MDLKAADRQVNRLASLHGWDRVEPSGRDELVAQMAAVFPNEKTASAALALWMKNNKWVPTPADLHLLAAEFEEKPHVSGDSDCEYCEGSGFRQAWELHTYLGGVDRGGRPLKTVEKIDFERYRELQKLVDEVKQRVVEGVEACCCAYGRHLDRARRNERQRKEAEANEKRAKSA